MWYENSIYPPIETGYAFTSDVNDKLVKKFITGNFTQGSAILKIKCYNPIRLIVQHLPVKEKGKKIETNRMRDIHIIDTLSSVDIQENIKIGVKMIEIYEGLVCRENIKGFLLRKFDKLFVLRQNYKDEDIEIMQIMVKLSLNSLYGENIRKDVDKKSPVNQKLG